MSTKAMVDMRIGGSFNPRWADEVPGMANPYGAILQLRSTVGSVVEQAENARRLPVEKRALTLDRLAKAGQGALKRVEELAKAREYITEIERGHLDEVTRELATIPNIPNTNFAASQIRDHVRSQAKGKKLDVLNEALGDIEAIRAILGAPPMASGLTTEQWQMFRMRAIGRYLPHVQEQGRVLELASKFFEAAVRNATEMTAEAAGLKKNRAGQYVPEWELDV